MHTVSRPNRRLTYVVTHLTHGGAEMQVVALSRAMRARGWQPHVVSLMPPSGGVDLVLRDEDIPFRSLGVPQGRYSPRLVLGLRRILREWQPAILHSHTLPANFVARVTRVLAPVPVLVSSAHNVDEGGRGRMLFYRLTDRLSDRTTNCSAAAVQRFVELRAAPEERIVYMPNGIDLSRFSPDPDVRREKRAELGLDDDALVWLAVGRLTAQKDYPNMLAALASFLPSHPRSFVLIVGSGELEGAVADEVRARGLGERVRLLGVRTDVADLMRAADAYLMSSAWEGLPIVLLEASASALPTVATDVGGNDEIVRDGETGFLVPRGDPGALAAAMGRLAALSPEDRGRLGAQARAQVVRTFDLDSVADRWDRLYTELLEAR